MYENIIPEKLLYNNKNILSLMLIIGIFTLLYGSIKEKIVEPTSILIMIITCFFLYIFFKKKYNKKIKKLKRKSSNNNILELLCNKENSNTKICKYYNNATKNYNNILDILIQKYSSTLATS